ncbi:MAG TPA: carboxypeptidase regulatory-like domain-containing protein, partial [Pyrinomonadaceae bacterium]
FAPPNRSVNNLSANQTAFDFTGTPGALVVGGQVTENGNPLPGVTVTLTGTQNATTTTDAAGNYSFNVAMGGNYTVTPSLASYTFAPPSRTFNNLSANQTANFTATLNSFTISGRVRDALDANLGGVLVTLTGAQSRTATTGADGLYSFANLPAGGAYTATPALSGFAFNPTARNFPNLSQNENFDFTGTPSVSTPAGANVTVSVSDFDVTFSVVNTPGTTSASPINPATAGTLPAGYTLLPGGRAADITTTVGFSGLVTVCTRAPSINDPQTFAALRLLHGEGGALVDRTSSSSFIARRVCGQVASLSPFTLGLAPQLGAQIISGRITNLTGSGVDGVLLVVTDPETGVILTTTTTNSNGNYTLALQPGGSYTITTSKAGMIFSPASRTFIDLGGGGSGGQISNVAAVEGITISGRVAGVNGNGIGNVNVTLSGSVTRTTFTLPNGNFLFNNLPPKGDYVVQADSGLLTFTPSQIVRPGLDASVTFNVVATPRPAFVPTSSIEENFNGNTRDPLKFTEGVLTQTPGSHDRLVTAVQEAGKLKITPRTGITEGSFNGYVSVRSVDFNDAQASIEVNETSDNGAQTLFAIGRDERNYFRFVTQDVAPLPDLRAGKSSDGARARTIGLRRLIFQARNAGVLNGLPTSIPYDPVQHRYWRFRHEPAASAMLFETSPDRVVWTERRRVPLGAPPGALAVELNAGTAGRASNPGQTLFDNLLVQPSNIVNRANNVRLAQSSYTVNEGAGVLTFKAMRAGDTSVETKIDYATEPFDGKPCNTVDGRARPRCDFATTAGTLRFAPGETEKTFNVFITDDTYVEGNETMRVALGFPSAGFVEEPATATVTIIDNDSGARPNLINTAEFLVRQQYLDFLNREPDTAGFNAWVGVLKRCAYEGHFGPGKSGSDPSCDRITVSSSFFRAPEFQIKGYFVHRFYKAALGRLPSYEEFLRDTTSVTGETEAEVIAKREAYANAWIERADFLALTEGITNAEYVDGLAATSGVTVQNRAQLVLDLDAGRKTRAQALRAVVDSPEFFDREFNAAFVLMQYFGYLQRDPDEAGYQSWLNLLNDTGDFRTMIFGFLYSQEYQLRFGTP